MKLVKKGLTYLFIALLALACAVNYQIFVFPNQFAPSGLNGICTMIQHMLGINLGYLSLMINVPLAFLVLFKVGRSLAGRSMVFVTAFSLFLILLEKTDLSQFAYETASGTSKILGPLVAGVINGGCYSLLIRCNTCSGGTDFIAAAIHRDRPDLNFFTITLGINAFVAVASYFVYDFQMEPVVLCIMYSFMSSTISDRITKNFRSAIHCEIITDYPQEISNAIIQRLHHSATLVPGKGMYLGRETNILICIVNKTQVAALAEIVKSFPHSFAVISSASDVVGNFKRLSNRGQPEFDFLDRGDGQNV